MSRKNKILRAFLHQTQSPTIEQAWDTAWEHAQKAFHARSMQDMEERLDAAQAECERLRGLLRDTASVAIAMLYDSHKADVLAEFKVPELEAVVDASKHLQSHRVEHVYRRAWDAAIDAAMRRENKT